MGVEPGPGQGPLVGVGVGVAVVVGVEAYEVVHAPAAPDGGGFEEVGAGEVLEEFLGVVQRAVGHVGVGEVGGGLGGDVGARVEREEAEQAGVVGVEVAVGQVERGADGAVLATQPLQPGVFAGQGGGEGGEGSGGGVGEEGRGDVQGQRQARAHACDGGGGVGFVVDAGVVGAAGGQERAAQEFDGVGVGKGVEVVEAGVEVEGVAGGDKGCGDPVGGQ
ncbi:hypothetical protein EHYA_10395 [Embleya hyalina]|uniref:Uncharacterized protein n=1 Tax=Embleya hyalina TaxID=516124 RepID=A0A401Z722_9ACTN|nr:hypothetical protein EHYA_10395 [Embleya hyalina]